MEKEIRQASFPLNLKASFLQKRRSENTLLDFNIRKQKQLENEVQMDAQICSVCKMHYIEGVTTNCKHYCCYKCLTDYMLQNPKKCPQCHTSLKFNDPLISSLTINEKIKKLQSNNTEYIERLNETQQWLNQRKVSEFKVGMLLDVFDTECIWCKGEVKEITKIGIKIHYLGWKSVYDEIIEINSDRLAPLGTFTNRADITKYKESEGETLRRHVIGGANNLNGQNHFILFIHALRWS